MIKVHSIKELKKLLIPRMWNFVPSNSSKGLISPWETKFNEDYKIKSINPDDPKELSLAKRFFLEHFYPKAPIPRALQMMENNNKRVQDFIEKEMNMYMKSGISVMLLDVDNQPQGVGLSALWKRDPSYEIIVTDAITWHNAAAEIAHEVEQEESRLMWRDYQFQHLYNLSQLSLAQAHAEYIVWMGCLCFSEKMRKKESFKHFLQQSYTQSISRQFLFGTQNNIKSLEKPSREFFSEIIIYETVRYCDENLIFRNQKVFEILESLESIQFFIGIPAQ